MAAALDWESSRHSKHCVEEPSDEEDAGGDDANEGCDERWPQHLARDDHLRERQPDLGHYEREHGDLGSTLPSRASTTGIMADALEYIGTPTTTAAGTDHHADFPMKLARRPFGT